MPEKIQSNCFDLIRLLLAVAVVYTHAYTLCGIEEPTHASFRRQLPIGSLAVLGFFGVSGYLVSASWDRTPGFATFLKKRVLRIFPGFLACLVVLATVVGPLLYRLREIPLGEYPWTGSDGALNYVLRNSLLRVNQWSIGRAVADAPYNESLDGSLWSIFPEFCCYVLTAAVGLLTCTRKNRWLLAGLTAYVATAHAGVVFRGDGGHAVDLLAGPTLLTLSQNTKFYLAYLTGMLLWSFRDRYEVNREAVIVLGVVFAVSLRFGGLLLFGPVLVPALLVNVAQLARVNVKVDLSYGLYLYHFPILQLLVAVDGLQTQPEVILILGILLSGMAAYLSWILVESPAIRLKRRTAMMHPETCGSS